MKKAIRNFFATLMILIMVAFWGCADDFCPPAQADIWDDFSNSTTTGYIVRGEHNAYIQNITVFEPAGEEILGIPIKLVRLKIVSFDGVEVVDDLLALGQTGISDTFYPSYRKLDEPFDLNAGGFVYDFARHWWGEEMPPVFLGFYVMESGNPLYTLYTDIDLNQFFGESLNGYSVGCDVLVGMESWTNPDFREYEVWIIKDTDPEGNTFLKASITNIVENTTIMFGAGITF